MKILGVWDGHDAGAAVLIDGRLTAAANEERFTRRKLEVRFPSRSIDACLTQASLRPGDVDVVAITTSDPAKTLGRLWPASKERHYAVRRRIAPPGLLSAATRQAKYRLTEWSPNAATRMLSRMLVRRLLARHGVGGAALHLIDHHEAHAAAAAWGSGFDSCAVLTIDGLGDGMSASISSFREGRLQRLRASPARWSLGVFFEHVTNLLNMRELEDEGKVMALADYAAPIADEANPLLRLIEVRDGIIRTTYAGHALRRPLAKLHWHYANEQFAYLSQRTVERVCTALARDALRITGETRLAIAGGVASNVKATRQVRLLPEVEAVYVFPHMGDGGLALGAAVVAASGRDAVDLDLRDLGLGPAFDAQAIEAALRRAGAEAARPACLVSRVADTLASGGVVMWFQGRMEYGPRALGHRSVLARPDRPAVRDRLNLVLKRRVWYQPFCPSMLESEAPRLLADWTDGPNHAMTMAFEVRHEWRGALAGVLSVDGTCRPQFVPDRQDTAYARLLIEARRRWGVGAVLNTSFNVHGEPLVCTPEDAVDVFLRSGADLLAIGDLVVEHPSAWAATLARVAERGA